MSLSLPPEVEASYSAIIDSILAASDLNTISAKRIRKGLQAAVDYDITPQKDAITELIMARFDKFNSENSHSAVAPADAQNGTIDPPPTTNGASAKPATSRSDDPMDLSVDASPKKREHDNDESDLTEPVEQSSPPPPKKKQKRVRTTEDEDAAFAARLQAEENSRARATRGGAVRKRTTPQKKKTTPSKKRKSAAKVLDGDDSDLASGSGVEKKEVKRTGGFHKPMTLSAPLSQLLGEISLSRPQTVKKVWDYIKAHSLQDPSDKRQIRCDGAMRAVFKTDRVHMFTMNKILNQNLYAQDE